MYDIHDAANPDCPRQQTGAEQGRCLCALRRNIKIPSFQVVDPNACSLDELRAAYLSLAAHRVEEARELYRRSQRSLAVVRQRLESMRARPRMWASNQESFVLQIVTLLEVVGIHMQPNMWEKYIGMFDSNVESADTVNDGYALAFADRALELLPP